MDRDTLHKNKLPPITKRMEGPNLLEIKIPEGHQVNPTTQKYMSVRFEADGKLINRSVLGDRQQYLDRSQSPKKKIKRGYTRKATKLVKSSTKIMVGRSKTIMSGRTIQVDDSYGLRSNPAIGDSSPQNIASQVQFQIGSPDNFSRKGSQYQGEAGPAGTDRLSRALGRHNAMEAQWQEA